MKFRGYNYSAALTVISVVLYIADYITNYLTNNDLIHNALFSFTCTSTALVVYR